MKPFARWCIWLGAAASGATGVVYWWMLEMMEPVSEFAVIHHPLQPWVLKAHIVTAPLLVFAFGLIAVDHVWRQYRLGIRAGRRSGTAAMWVFVPMVLSGYLIQAVTAPIWLTALAWVHVGTGLAFLTGLAVHQVVVPRRRSRRNLRVVDLDVLPAEPAEERPPRTVRGGERRRGPPASARQRVGEGSSSDV